MDRSLDRKALFDANAYHRGSRMPWSFLAWPSALDDDAHLPRNDEAVRFLALLQARGVPLGTWRLPENVGVRHTWAVVRGEDRHLVFEAIAALERDGTFPAGYLDALAERLMSLPPDR